MELDGAFDGTTETESEGMRVGSRVTDGEIEGASDSFVIGNGWGSSSSEGTVDLMKEGKLVEGERLGL